jgi:hypothetical protein
MLKLFVRKQFCSKRISFSCFRLLAEVFEKNILRRFCNNIFEVEKTETFENTWRFSERYIIAYRKTQNLYQLHHFERDMKTILNNFYIL